MPNLFWDIETRSAISLEDAGTFRYAADPSTDVICVAYAIDDGDPQIWAPEQNIPAEFSAAAKDPSWLVIAHNYMFERAISAYVLEPRYGWPTIPLSQHRCTMTMALANALPPALDDVTTALGLPYQKDREGYLLMRRMTRPRRDGTYVDGDAERKRLAAYCKTDVEAERAVYYRLPPLSPAEQSLWELDAVINARGFFIDRRLAQAARGVTRQELAVLNTEIAALTNGEVTSVNQVQRILAFLRRHGHTIESLTKRSVSTILAHDPSENVHNLLELRRVGARASTRKFDALLRSVDLDNRLRGTLRFHAAATGRWSGSKFQPQNLKKPEIKDLDAAIDAIMGGDMDRVREVGAPLTVAGDISRAVICAAPGHVLIGGDFSAIESRVLAWLAGEQWKINAYQQFDATGDPALEPYCSIASKALRRLVTPDDEAGRAFGKINDLAFGFGGGVGAWRKFDTTDTYSDGQIEQFKRAFRAEHRATMRFWKSLAHAAHLCVRSGKVIEFRKFKFTIENGTLFMQLPSGRRLAYPEARVQPGKFDGTFELRHKDNAKGGWIDVGSWYGTLTENCVQAVARDLLGAAMLRLEKVSYPVVLHVHDELVCEIPDDFGSIDEFQRLMTALPDWAAGLPIAAKVWMRQRYAKSKTEAIKPMHSTEVWIPRPDMVPAPSEALEEEIEYTAAEVGSVPLTALIREPLVGGKICCPFHDDHAPSLVVYPDHFHCYVCNAHGDAVDWLVEVEGLVRAEAERVVSTWDGPVLDQPVGLDKEIARLGALRLWGEATPVPGTLAARYLSDVRKIDLSELPADVDATLRFHPHCPFGPGTRHPCLLALMRELSDTPTGIQRIALTPDARKIERRMMGQSGIVKLWSAGPTLVAGEGLETVLAAATRVRYRGAPLRPAWAATSAGSLSKLPVISGVERLIILLDHDDAGRTAASSCTERWTRAGRTVVRLIPKRSGADFNDMIMEPI